MSATVPQPPHDVTRLLDAAADGDTEAADRLLPVVYDELRRFAASLLAQEQLVGSATLQPTLLVHEAYLRLVGLGDVRWEGRRHFFGAAARAMRQILIDRARHIRAMRPPSYPLASSADLADPDAPKSAALPADPDEFLALDAALNSLAARAGGARQHEVVMLRYFAGLTIEETARALNVSTGTVKSDWLYARAWLLRELEQDPSSPDREARP